jgi:glycosyl transferase family 2
MTVSVVLPTYRERETILGLMGEIHSVLPEAEIVVVGDDSPDRTWAVVEEAFSDDPRVRVIRRIGRRGLPGALGGACRRQRGSARLARCRWLDAASGHPRATGWSRSGGRGRRLSLCPEGEDVRDSRFRIVTSRTINLLAAALLSGKVRDYTSGSWPCDVAPSNGCHYERTTPTATTA